MTPKVQSLADIMTELAPAYNQQTSLIQQQQAGLGEKYTAQQSALEAQKTSGFNQINNQATGRGMSFSGIPLDEQASYLADTYLPAVANLKASQNTESTQLQSQLADIYSNQYTQAYNARNTQQSSLDQWNLQQMQNEFTASESAKDRAATAANKAADNAAPTAQQYMTDAFSDAITTNPSGWRSDYSTEGIIDDLATQYGMTQQEASDMAYKWRKSKFNF